MSRSGTVALLLATVATSGASPALAQSQLADEQPRFGWDQAWSPLQARADLPRRLPAPHATAASLLLPATRVGLFWTAGNPAALRDELTDSRSDYAVGFVRESGTLRRPLDPVATRGRTASAHGGTVTGERLAFLGGALLDQQEFDPGTYANVAEAYPSSPFVTIDTSRNATRRTRVRVEGALSVRLRAWAIGTAIGYEAHERQSMASGLVRRTRYVLPGVTAGITRRVGPVRFGPYARLRVRAETVFLIEREGEGLVLQLEGLREVPRLDILGVYYRRIEERVPSVGWSAGGSAMGGTWSGHVERGWLRERLTRQETNNPAEDRWDAGAWTGGLAFQRSVSPRALLTLHAHHSALRGEGDLALDSAGPIFRAQERATSMRAEWRLSGDGVPWSFVTGLQATLEHRVRDAVSIPIASAQTGLTTVLSVEAGRQVTQRLFMTATLAGGHYSARSSFPAPFAMGPTYREYILPEYDLFSRRARPALVAVALRWATGVHSWVWLRGSSTYVSALQGPATAFGSDGSRKAVSVLAGVTHRGL